MREHTINNLDNFMGGWYMDDTTICDKIMKWHDTTPLRGDGVINIKPTSPNQMVGTTEVHKSIKDSIDSELNSNPTLANEYVLHLQKSLNAYIEKYTWCNKYSQFAVFEPVNVQYYKPGGGYYMWHTERGGSFFPESSRHLVFMTYLNDVHDDGETEFLHQKLKIKPEKGLTLIWPADWTFTHRGITSPTEDKYIVTGWFNYIPDDIVLQPNK